jgi:hypothetical protein
MSTAKNAAVLAGGIREAGRQLGIGTNAAYRAAQRGEIPARRIGHKWVITKPAWKRFLLGLDGKVQRN